MIDFFNFFNIKFFFFPENFDKTENNIISAEAA